MFGYPCPFCSQRLLAAPERAGQRTICPKCLKPIVIPKPDEKQPDVHAALSSLDVEPDEVPISVMPTGLDDESSDLDDRTPIPEARPAARIGPAAGTHHDPIPLQPAAALLVRNPDSVSDLSSIPDLPDPVPAMAPTPLPLPMPSFPEPMFPAPAYSPPSYQPPKFAAPAPLPTPAYPSPGRITGDHPAASLPPPSANGSHTAGLVVFNPTDVEAANIAAELTTVISLKMKPAPEPPSDLRLTTGLWIILTACGAALWLFCMMSDTEPLKYVAVIGTVELLIGYFWVAIAYGNRHPRQGLTTLLPPLWVYRAANPPYEPGYRPLRFVVAGAVLLSLYVIAPKVQPTLFAWIGISEDPPAPASEKPETPLMALQTAENDGDTLGVKRQLALFAKTESMILTPAHEKPAVIVTLKRLVRHVRPEVRVEALRSLVLWSKDDAKAPVLAALKAGNEEERESAYELVSNWHDVETVKLLVSQLGANPLSRPALEAVGKSERGRSAIEEAILPLVRANGVENRFELLALASEFGGENVLRVLEAQLAAAKSPGDRDSLPLCIAKIKSRLRK